LGTPASAQGFKWWQSDNFRHGLGLTQDQSTHIEAIFQQSLAGLRKQKGALDKAEADFNQMVEASDDAQVMAMARAVGFPPRSRKYLQPWSRSP